MRRSLSSPGQPVQTSRATWTGSRASRPGPPGGHPPPLQPQRQLQQRPPLPQPQQPPLQRQQQPPNLPHPLLDSLFWSSSKNSNGDSSSSNLLLSSSSDLLPSSSSNNLPPSSKGNLLQRDLCFSSNSS